jgi:hypothetical protein
MLSMRLDTRASRGSSPERAAPIAWREQRPGTGTGTEHDLAPTVSSITCNIDVTHHLRQRVSSHRDDAGSVQRP